ncbi:MAG: MraY family glycosyltransferase [Myxococcales bacterium]
MTLVTTPLVRAWALRHGVVDAPGGRRVHTKVTPRLGGVALFVGFFAPLAGLALWGTEAMGALERSPGDILGLVLGACVVVFVGAWDDAKGLGAWPKLLAQATAATVAYALGYRIEAIDLPLLGSLQMGPVTYVVTLFWFLGIINALNLIDGLDGLAAGIALFASLSNFAISYFGGHHVIAMLSASLAGALFGFLRYNFNPARIFMGDSGSMFLGFVLAATSLKGATTKSSTAVAILAPMMALGVPIFDTMLAMIRRALARQSIFAADRGHIHHRLLDLGLTHRRVVLLLYGGSIVLALAAVAVAFDRSLELGVLLMLGGGSLFLLVRSAGLMDSPEERDRKSLRRRVQAAHTALAAASDESEISQALELLGPVQRLTVLAGPGGRMAVEELGGAAWTAFLISTASRSYRLEFERQRFACVEGELDKLLRTVVEQLLKALERTEQQKQSLALDVARASVVGE